MAAATIASTPHQTSPLRFADAFWDPSDRGVNVIVQKLQNSKQTCEEVKKLYEIRSQIEEDYGDRLLKLSQLIVGQTEEGTLSESLSHIPSALETTARAHMDLAQQLKYHLEEPLDDFIQEQRDRRKQYQQQIEKALQLKNMHYTNATKAKEFYTAECTKVAGMEKYLRLCGPEMTPEELDQTREEIDEGKKMMLSAEQDFKRAIDAYNSVTSDWIEIWRASCDTFQDMETQRIDYVHASLRSFATMMSSVCLVDDQCCERIRTTVDMTNSQQDIEAFITRYGTGSDAPELMKFEAFMGMDLRASPAPSDKQESEQPKKDESPETHEPSVSDNMSQQLEHREIHEAQLGDNLPVHPIEETHKDYNGAVEGLEIGEVPKAEIASLKSLELPAKPESVKAIDSESESESESDSDDSSEMEVLESMTLHGNVEDPMISAIQEVEELLHAEQTFQETTEKDNSDDDRALASSEERSAPPTPSLPIPVAMSLPEKEESSSHTSAIVAPMPSDAIKNKHMTEEDEHVVVNTETPVTPIAATADTGQVNGPDSDRTVAAEVIPVATNTDNSKPAALQIATFDTSTSIVAQSHEVPEPVAAVIRPSPESLPKETIAAESVSKDLPPTPVAISVAASSSNVEQTPLECHPRSPRPIAGVQLSDSIPNVNSTDDESEGDDESDKDYQPPPAKAEKWVISSIRRPQQLPVRVQDARMSMSVMSTPSLPTALDADHFRQPSTSTGHKFSRPNAPFKIEIPNKIASSSAFHGSNTDPTRSQQEQHYTAPQTAAQQVIAAGRAHAHQASSWQSPVSSTPNRRFSSVDPKRYHDYHRPLEPMAEHHTLYEVDDEIPGRKSLDSRLDSNASSNSNSNSAQTKKSHHLSSFVKGVLKPDNLVSKQQFGTTLTVEKPVKDKSKDKRFSMNIFGGRKDKQRNKQQQQQDQLYDPIIPIFEDSEMYNGSRSTPLLRPSTAAAAPGRSYIQPHQHHSHHNLYQQAQQQQQIQEPPDRLEDGAVVLEYVRAIWTYEAKIPSELSFMSGDGLAVINKQIDGWWLAELMDPQRRRRGLVPGNYMESATT
ncbi:hypothetical protein BX666DRAFT_2113377 [Dichotomocladium elegans]|nr:hypothetical protein BX666DRAFT_2113377 [Dichotomocladium elegans]